MKYPIGIQSFEEIRTSGYAYVDKTTLIDKLVAEGKYYFLSRPRRFGKSLLLSTMGACFEGKRHLFQGLAIEHLEQDWTEYPILYLDLNALDYSSRDALIAELNKHLEQWEMLYCGQRSDRAIEERFGAVIKAAAQKTGKEGGHPRGRIRQAHATDKRKLFKIGINFSTQTARIDDWKIA